MLMEHNIPVYEKFEAMLEKHGKVILITATGTGKSYVTLEYLERHNLRALVVCPKVSICNNWKKLTDKVDTITYQKLSKINSFHEDKLINYTNAYNLIVFDEAHHIGGKIWSKAFNKLVSIIESSKCECKIIGLTADSKRYFENGRDVAEEYFDSNIIYGYSQAEAIENGVLPKAEYIVSLFNIDEAYQRYVSKRTSLSTRLIGQLDYVFKNTGSIKDIIYKHIPIGNRKGIIFVDRIKSIDNAINLFKNIFPNEEFFFIHSEMNKEKNNRILEDFDKADHGFIITIDMLNEGLHIDGVNTIIMLRRTESPMVYIQQLGRGLASNGKNIIIFDFVGNASNIKISYNNIEEIENISESNRKYIRKLSNQFIVHDYMTPILNILHIIEEGICKKYTKYEDEFLKANYKKHGPSYCAEMLNRTPGSISSRAAILNLTFLNKWTSDEDKFLIDNIYTMSVEDISSKLNRSIASINNRKHILNLTDSNRIDKDIVDKVISTKRDNESWSSLSKRSGISDNILRYRAKELGLYTAHKKHIWTENEIEFLKSNYELKGPDYCSNYLNIPKSIVKYKATKDLKLKFVKPWSDEEIKMLKSMVFDDYSYDEMAKSLNRNRSSICNMIGRLGLTKKRKYTKEDDNFLKENYITLGAKECSLILNRTRSSIYDRARSLGIDTSANQVHWTNEMDKILIENYPKIGLECVSMIEGVDKFNCKSRVKILKLKPPKSPRKISEDEMLFIRRYYPIIGIKVREYTNRSSSTVYYAANNNNIKASKNIYKWTCAELVEIDYYLSSTENIDKLYLVSKYNKPIEAIDQIINIFNTVQ